jgi:hypothetical protein
MNFIKFSILSPFLLLFGILNYSLTQWIQLPNGIGTQQATSVAAGGNYLHAGTRFNGVYSSTNNGDLWIQTSLNNREIEVVAANGSNVFAGTFGFPTSYGVYKSTNNGVNWVQTSLNSQIVETIVINGNNIFAGCDFNGSSYGVYLSTDNGSSWNQTSLNNRIVYSLALNGNNIIAGSSLYGVYISSNNGVNWTQTSLNNRTIFALALGGNNVYAGTSVDGVYLSTNNGTNWSITALNNRQILSLAVSGNYIIAGTTTDGVYLSNNNGVSWTQRNEGLGATEIISLAISNNYIFAGTNAGVWRRPLSEIIAVNPISNEVPKDFKLEQNYPNPFNPTTKIRFSIPHVGDAYMRPVQMKIYDVLGREIATLVNEQLNPGTYEIQWNATNYPSGVYYYQLTAGDASATLSMTKKMVLIK